MIDVKPRNARVAAALAATGIEPDIKILDADAKTAVAAAEQLGCEVGAIANSLVFWADDAPLLVLTSGRHRVDTRALASVLGKSVVSRATPDQVRAATGQAIGGVAPVGHPAPVETIVDVALADYRQVWAAGGTPHTLFPTTFDELVRVTGGRSLVVGE